MSDQSPSSPRPSPSDDAARLDALRRYAILDTAPEPAFDDIAHLAARICRASIALVSLVDAHRQWFKARVGTDLAETPIGTSFCAHAMRQGGLFVVPDTHRDDRFKDNDLVAGVPFVRFYAGSVLVTPEGVPLGTLCVLDGTPRPAGLTGDQAEALETLGRQVVGQLELRRTVGELGHERAQLRAVLDSVPIGLMFGEAPGGRITGGNSRAEQIFRHPILDAPGTEEHARWIAFHPDGRPLQAQEHPLSRAILLEEISELEEYHYQRGDGTRGWITLSAAPVRDPDGRISGGVVAVQDIDEAVQARETLRRSAAELEALVSERTAALEITNARLRAEAEERSRVEDALRQSQKMEAVGQLTGGIAHDFNNLLTGIVGSLELMRNRIAQGRIPDVDRLLLAAMNSANRAAALTHRLLAFSRRQTLDPRPTDVNKLVLSMEDLVRRTCGEAIPVEFVAAGGLWRTLCDANQLENVLLNLAINARDAMPEGGRLVIETSNAFLDDAYVAGLNDVRAGQYVCLAVTDTGVGMTPAVVARVFDPFFTTKPIGQGTGLGLSMVFGFVKQSGGHVRVYSEVGGGTTVKIYLPRYRNGAAANAEAGGEVRRHDPVPGVAQGITVLVVEDDSTVRMLVLEVLGGLGYGVLEATDGQAGLKVVESGAAIDLLVTDVGLPGMNGRQLADAARRLRPGLEVLFITGYAHNAAIGNGVLDPGMHVISKPFALNALTAKIRELTGRDGAGT